MIVEWSTASQECVRRFMGDQDGLHELVMAVMSLAVDPRPPGSFPWGRYRRLRVGAYRVMYRVGERTVLITYVDRVPD